jgi:hypothetical protein
MTGFDKKCLHVSHDAQCPVAITIEVDFMGDGTWRTYDVLEVGADGYAHHEFSDAFSAHWVRVKTDKDCTATAQFHYS